MGESAKIDEAHAVAYEAAALRALAEFGVEAADLTRVAVAENITYRVYTANPSESFVLLQLQTRLEIGLFPLF